MKGLLVKWDATLIDESNPPNVADPNMDPATHPGCIEVIELNEGQDPRIIYRRDDHAADDLGRTIPG